MDIRSKFSFNIPEALIDALGITVTVEPILEEGEGTI